MKVIAQAAQTPVLLGVQILRAVASLGVVINHVLREAHVIAGAKVPAFMTLLGASGVDLFFVVSGFIMVHTNRSLIGRKGSAKDFLVRRFIRVVPLYWICTVLVLALHSTGLFYRNLAVTPYSIVASLFFFPNDSAILFVGWTLNYEMYFYMIFALLMCFLTTSALVAIFPLILGSVLLASAWLPPGPERTFFGNPIALEFSFGAIVAVLDTRTAQFDRFAPVALLIGSVGLVASSILAPRVGTGGLDPSVRFLLWGVPSAALLWSALRLRTVNGRIGDILMHLGDASYSIYLTHAVVVTVYARALKTGFVSDLPPALSMLAAVAVSLAVGSTTYVFVEHPVDRWLKAAWRSRRQRADVLSRTGSAGSAASAT